MTTPRHKLFLSQWLNPSIRNHFEHRGRKYFMREDSLYTKAPGPFENFEGGGYKNKLNKK